MWPGNDKRDCESELDDARYEREQVDDKARRDRQNARIEMDRARSAAAEDYAHLEEDFKNLNESYDALNAKYLRALGALRLAHTALQWHPHGDSRSTQCLEAANAVFAEAPVVNLGGK